MKLLRYGPIGQEMPGLLDNSGGIRDLSGYIPDITPEVLEARLGALADIDPESLPAVDGDVRIGPPVNGVSKIVCVGLNYRKHAAETNMEVPDEPLLFMKATTSIIGPNDPVILPKGATKGDWEVEFGIVIGKTAQYVEESAALEHVAGYCTVNDVSERAFQLEHMGQWVKGKSADTFAPIGPWLVTRDEVPDPGALDLWLEVNGHRFQDSNTSDNIFSVPFLVSYISRFMTLLPGDIISTGTPEGVGAGQTPPVFLKPGDVMRLGVDGLGEQRQDVRAYNR